MVFDKRWRKKVEQGGLAALARKHGRGQFSELTPDQLAELKEIIAKGPYHAAEKMKKFGTLPSLRPLCTLCTLRGKMNHREHKAFIKDTKGFTVLTLIR